jgi:hypothetical protein
MLAVSVDEAKDLPKVRSLVASEPFAFAMLAQTQAYGRIRRLPRTFIIDRKGRLVADGCRDARKTCDLRALAADLLPLRHAE